MSPVYPSTLPSRLTGREAMWTPPLNEARASGTAVVANGTTSIVVTYDTFGSRTPAASDVTVLPTNNLGAASHFWVTAIGPTSFTINVDVDPGATTATFAWSIRFGFKEVFGSGTNWMRLSDSPNLVVNNVTGIANRAWQMLLGASAVDPEQGYGRGAWWKKTYIFRCCSMPFRLTNPSTATAFGGIQIGTPFISGVTINPPWEANPQNAYCRLGKVLNTDNDHFCEVAPGDGVTAKKRTQFSVPEPIADGLNVLELVYDPYARVVICRVNGLTVYTESELVKLPQFGLGLLQVAQGAGFFLETGTGAADRVQGFWAFPQVFASMGEPAPLWY